MFQHFIFDSAFSSFILLFGTFSYSITSTFSSFILIYSVIMIFSFTFEIKFPNVLNGKLYLNKIISRFDYSRGVPTKQKYSSASDSPCPSFSFTRGTEKS